MTLREADLEKKKFEVLEKDFLHKELNRVKRKFIEVIHGIGKMESEVSNSFTEILQVNSKLTTENYFLRKGLESAVPGQKSFDKYFNLQGKSLELISHKRVKSFINQSKPQSVTNKGSTSLYQLKILETIKSNLDDLLDFRPHSDMITTTVSENSDCVDSLYKEFELSQYGSALKSKSL